jgi:hypothetical protein
MTRDEAAALLGAKMDATAADVQRRYEELHNEYQVRLTNAPTPALKKTYQKNLQDLRDACEVLAPGSVTSPVAADLPAAEPTLTSGTSAARPARPVSGPASREAARAQDAGLPRSTMATLAVAVLLAAGASLLLLLWRGAVRTGDETAQRLAETVVALEKTETTLKDYQQVFQTAPLDVCNRSSKPVRIETVVAMYRDQSGKRRTVHSGSYGYPPWDIPAGSRSRLAILRGQPDDWDGAATVYALQLIYGNSEPFLMAGVIADAKDGCVNLYLD